MNLSEVWTLIGMDFVSELEAMWQESCESGVARFQACASALMM